MTTAVGYIAAWALDCRIRPSIPWHRRTVMHCLTVVERRGVDFRWPASRVRARGRGVSGTLIFAGDSGQDSIGNTKTAACGAAQRRLPGRDPLNRGL